jgi:UMP-CMP kinase
MFIYPPAIYYVLNGKKKSSKNGQLIESCIKEGILVPVEVVLALLKEAMESNAKATGAHKFLIDGFPRNKENLDGWEKNIKGVKTEFVLFLDCDEKTMEERLITRGKTSGRADDNIETIKKRFATFQESTKPIVDYFASVGKLRRVSAGGSVDEIFSEISKLFNQIEPAKGEPAKAEPAKSDPAKSVPAIAEPAKSVPASAEPAKSDPASVEPAKSEQANDEPAKFEPIKTSEMGAN